MHLVLEKAVLQLQHPWDPISKIISEDETTTNPMGRYIIEDKRKIRFNTMTRPINYLSVLRKLLVQKAFSEPIRGRSG
jgi:hypothetical protein